MAGLATCDPDFPIREWDRLVQHAELTLNLLRNSRVNPHLSSWAYLFGNFDFNKCPLAPPGTKVVIHSKPSQRKSWAFHGEQGWFVGPALNHYRCLTIYIPKTRAVRITDTAVLIPKMVPIPNADINSHLARTADDLVHLLNGKRDIISPLPNPSVKDALIKIAQLLHRDSTPILSELPCTNIATSEGENSHNSMVTKTQIPALDKQISEGETQNVIQHFIPVFKKTLQPTIPADMPLHPALYPKIVKERINSPPIRNNAISNQKTKGNLRVEEQPIKSLLKEFATIPKDIKSSTKKSIRNKFKLPNHKSVLYAPTPKSYSPKQLLEHPMALRKRSMLKYPTMPRSYKTRAAEHLLLQHMASNPEMFDFKGKKKSIDLLLREDEVTWGGSLSNEIGRLAQGIRDIKGNNAIIFIPKHKIPKGKKVAYANMVCDLRPLKKEKHRVRLTLGGDVLEYEGNASSPAASLLEAKLLINSTISDAQAGARFMSADLKDFFLQSFLEEPEYIRIHGKYFLSDIRQKYNIDAIIAEDGYVYCEAIRGMYGLK